MSDLAAGAGAAHAPAGAAPVERERRGDGRRTYVRVDGLSEPIVASRSEQAIAATSERRSPRLLACGRRRGRGEP
jgi:hypothetical protein